MYGKMYFSQNVEASREGLATGPQTGTSKHSTYIATIFLFAYMKCENKTQIRFSYLLFCMTNYTPL